MAIKPAIRLAGKHPFFWVALLVGVLLLGFYIFAGLMIFRYGTSSKDFGWEYSSRGDQWYVSEVDPNGVAANKLQTGEISKRNAKALALFFHVPAELFI